jgi:cytoskeletal protein RodZ
MPEDTLINANKANKSNKPLLGKRTLLIILIIIAELALLFAVFGVGYKIGQDVGKKDATVQAGLSGFNSLLGNVSNPFRSTTGKVASVSADSITVETSNGEKKIVKITSDTKVSRRSEPVSVTDIKTGVRASVFLDESASEPTATRIIINE